MPPKRSKKDQESDGEDYGEETEAPRPAKKTKDAKGKARDSASKAPVAKANVDGPVEIETNEEGDQYVTLSGRRRVTVRAFKGVSMVDIRETYPKDGKELPGKKGISLSLEQWAALKHAMGDIDKMVDAIEKSSKE